MVKATKCLTRSPWEKITSKRLSKERNAFDFPSGFSSKNKLGLGTMHLIKVSFSASDFEFFMMVMQ